MTGAEEMEEPRCLCHGSFEVHAWLARNKRGRCLGYVGFVKGQDGRTTQAHFDTAVEGLAAGVIAGRVYPCTCGSYRQASSHPCEDRQR